ncbi:unnamed protein product [Moneuplotes crassus]|uniref:Uncharacterized protein n=1 Tax=Euplotes crassus TaxID=5936 RepID=A0AAD1X7M6_EUPCR|nr:unnamed protein product [Moneuplotes crassus]
MIPTKAIITISNTFFKHFKHFIHTNPTRSFISIPYEKFIQKLYPSLFPIPYPIQSLHLSKPPSPIP